MKVESQSDPLIPPALLAEVEAIAAAEHRSAPDMVREAVERYVRERQTFTAKLTPQEAVARILELRKGNRLPEGETIKDLINYGRA